MQLYNSLTKQKHEFKPVEKNKIKLYLCGMTVYDYCHIGHARSWVVFDVAIRYWRSRGYEVVYVHNITDIDDKIINRANEHGESCDALTERFIDAMHEDERALNLLKPTHEPRATQYVPQIITLIEKIIKEGGAYVADNGDVYFNVRQFKEYGKLSHRSIDDLISGARVDVNANKKDPLDFALWKTAKPDEPSWDSPWGRGRPGWHIECSAMSENILGQPFDIHGGGMDLKFPHHENEIAQSEAAHNCAFVNTWMHVGLLNIDDEKMSKSLNNFIKIREALKQYHPEVLRYFMLSGHYRSPINYSEKNMEQVQQSLSTLYTAIRGLNLSVAAVPSAYSEKFNQAMDDDLNSPEAFSVLFEMAREVNRLRAKNKTNEVVVLACELKNLASIFGFLQEKPDVFLQGDVDDAQKIEDLIAQRNKARADKDWAKADEMRDELVAMGIVIEDANGETTWRKA